MRKAGFNFVYYSKKDKLTMVLILVLTLLSIGIDLVLRLSDEVRVEDAVEFEQVYIEKYVNSTVVESPDMIPAGSQRSDPGSSKPKKEEKQKTNSVWEPFRFDPNTVHDSLWKKFGLSDKQVSVISNYKNKGGKFYKQDDMLKVYSITEDKYEQIKPYIDIDRNPGTIKSEFKIASARKPEINSCTTTELITTFNIKKPVAESIIRYRNSLGGFNSFDQLKEVTGVSDTMILKIEIAAEIDIRFLNKININTCRSGDISHPYISRGLARLIENYRVHHGRYTSPEELKQLTLVDEALYSKLLPYLIVE